MFKIISNPEFTHDVPVLVPVDGGHQEHKLRTRFRALSDDESAQFDTSTTDGIKEFLREVIVRFEDVVDDDGAPVPSDGALVDRMLGMPFVRIALVRAYARALSEARAGN